MAIPPLDAVVADKRLSEAACVARLLSDAPYDAAGAAAIQQQASAWVAQLRTETASASLLDTFLAEYDLSCEEGVALMCLAEAFLRIPDAATATLLVQDKLAEKDWRAHLGQAESWLVNSSTWALMLSGKTLEFSQDLSPDAWFNSLVLKLGQPLMQRAIRTAMQILGKEFVLGESIDRALQRSEPSVNTCYSYDMLGEGARDRAAAERYRQAYEAAIVAVGAAAGDNSLSVKLSALHPRFEPLQKKSALPQLTDTLVSLCSLARQHGVPVSIDAEEADRVQITLEMFARLCHDMKGWNGLGIVVQAYGKRAPAIIDWLAQLARETGRVIPVRLVKGAYWDAEIKLAQQQGLAEFPVYTRKFTTDAAYLHCAAELLRHEGLLYPQFATHNAHTLAAVLHLVSEETSFECQRLHGMGAHLYETVQAEYPRLQVRVYAPVGRHTDLLAYLVRRLLENGANSSFVNRLQNALLPLAELLRDPYDELRAVGQVENPYIAQPAQIYGDERRNSPGLDLSDADVVDQYWQPDIPLDVRPAADSNHALSRLDDMFSSARAAQPDWDESGGQARAACLDALADLLEARKTELHALLCTEAGKTISDCVDEVREAVDFCRYYAARGRSDFAAAQELPGPTGESNHLSLHGRGVFVCISPWNFPLAIFTGQLSAALMAGNAVIAKPAEPTPRIARFVLSLVHQAGVPEHVCQLVTGGAELGEALVTHPHCQGVAFTGSTAVARRINMQLAAREGAIVPLIAETGGQNAMIVDSTALLEQVTDDVVRSAFGSSGQRCSALRLLCLQKDTADAAIAMIQGAMLELKVGDPRDTDVDMGPIITRQACQALSRYVQDCRDKGYPVFAPELDLPEGGRHLPPTLVEIPGVAHLGDEQFGPVLHILRYDGAHIDALLQQINETGHGLTFGVHSRLDGRAGALAATSQAGNVYINRNMTGAVVGTQPFGGQGLSGTGPKAGGPHYLQRFAVEKTVTRNITATGGNLALLRET